MYSSWAKSNSSVSMPASESLSSFSSAGAVVVSSRPISSMDRVVPVVVFVDRHKKALLNL